MTFVQNMASRGNILSGLGLNRMVWLSVLTGPWSKVSSPCSIRLVCLCLSGVRLLLLSSMSGTGPPLLLCLARLPGSPSLASDLMSLCFVYGAVLLMFISKRTRGSGGVLGLTWRSASSLATLLTTRDGNSTILSPGSLSFQSVLSLMSATSLASRSLPLPSSLPP